MSLIEMKDITKIYNRGKENEFCALKDISLKIEEGSYVAIVGKSGSGKSTFLNIAGLIDQYSKGSLYFEGECMDHKSQNAVTKLRKEKIGFVLQDFGLIWGMNVFDNIAIPLFMNHFSAKVRKEMVEELAERMQLADLLYKPANTLSGGQSQRVAIARAIIHKPKLILADEPTGALDRESSKHVMHLLDDIHKDGTTILLVTHDESCLENCDRVLEIKDGRVVV